MSKEFACGNIYIRKNLLAEIGDRMNGHKHNFDHTTLFQRGSFHVRAVLPNGTVVERDFTAPDFALIRADVEHEIVATTPDSEFWCVYAHRFPQALASNKGVDAEYDAALARLADLADQAHGDIVQVENGWRDSAYV